MLGLYVHIPFCQAICSYCNFNRGLLDQDLKARYVAAVIREIREAGDGRAADTIFFGGGTPSLLDPAEVGAILDSCRLSYAVAPEVEITLEANPETATAARLAAFREAGVNRLSFGVQSFDDEQLLRLGRVHSAAKAVEAVGLARAVGFDNLSLDLMFWLPGQSRAAWLASVSQAIALGPDHLSLYLLELYPNAPLQETMARERAKALVGPHEPGARWEQAADDEAADMYLDGLERLDAAGFEQYEISNVAQPGMASRHNLKYWMAGEWRGFGCGAHSTIAAHRWKNVASTTDYVTRIVEGRSVRLDSDPLTQSEQVGDGLLTGLRLTAGIGRLEFQARFGIDPWQTYGRDLASCVDAGLIWSSSGRFGLTRRGMLLSNEILTLFV